MSEVGEAMDMMRYLGIEHDETKDAVKMNRVTDIVNYFKGFEDGVQVLRRVASKAPREERINRVWEYVKMRNEYDHLNTEVRGFDEEQEQKRKKLKVLKKDLAMYE